MSHPFARIHRSQSTQTLSGKKYRNGKTLSLDAAAFAAATQSAPKYRVYFTQILLCIGLTVYIFLPSSVLRDIGSWNKDSLLINFNSASNSENNTTDFPRPPKPQKQPLKTSIAIVAACKNRQSTLRKTLPMWRKVPEVREIVVVDWSSDPPLKSIVDEQDDSRIKLIRVEGEKSWVLSRAYNLAVNSTKFDYIIRTDCDYSLKENILEAHDLSLTEEGFYSGNWILARNPNEVHLNGAMIFSRKKFFNVGGYDERIQTYGWDDEDLYNRLSSRNLKRLNISYDHVSHVFHGDKQRAQKGVKFAQVQIDLNQLLLEKLPVWSKKGANVQHSTYTELETGKRYRRIQAEYIPKPLHELVDSNLLEESFSLSLGRRLADDFRVPWDILEAKNSSKRETLLRALMRLQIDLDEINGEGTEDPKNILPESNLNEFPKKARMLLVHAQHGLGNRMRAIASALSFAKSTARVPVVIWENDAHLSADFDALYNSENLSFISSFKPTWPFTELEKWDSSWKEFKFYNYMEMEEGAKKGEIIENDPEKHMYYKGAYIMEAPLHSSWETDNQNLRMLEPVSKVTQKLEELEANGLREAIGVHIRNRTLEKDIKNVDFNAEYGSSASSEMEHWREQSSYTNFIAEMNRIIEEDKDAKFFVATDTKEVITQIEERFPGRILAVSRDCDDRGSECVQFAMVDVYALSRTKRLLGSNWSSYTELAERLGGLKAELAGRDFGAATKEKEEEKLNANQLENDNQVIIKDAEGSDKTRGEMFDDGRE